MLLYVCYVYKLMYAVYQLVFKVDHLKYKMNCSL